MNTITYTDNREFMVFSLSVNVRHIM